MAKLVTKREYKRRRLRFQIAAGLVDFLVMLGCLALTFLCVVLVIELFNWLRGDVDSSFGVFTQIIDRVLHTN
ncbi:MAG: hypothetical protein II920_01800 [Clostridia bacterium]|nr:hypothetical protein [Clostridia bacterium]